MKALWQTVFGDDPAEIDSFFSCFFKKDIALIIRDGQSVLSMLFLIQATLIQNGQDCPIGYIYAGATHPQARGQGLYRRLLRAAEAEAASRGCQAVFLQPADERLSETYHRLGYTVPLFAHEQKGAAAPSEVSAVSAELYAERRRQRLMRAVVPFVEWPTSVFHHAACWSQCGVTADGNLMLLSDGPSRVILEQVDDTALLCQREIGRLKPLGDHVLMSEQRIYMGYGMD